MLNFRECIDLSSHMSCLEQGIIYHAKILVLPFVPQALVILIQFYLLLCGESLTSLHLILMYQPYVQEHLGCLAGFPSLCLSLCSFHTFWFYSHRPVDFHHWRYSSLLSQTGPGSAFLRQMKPSHSQLSCQKTPCQQWGRAAAVMAGVHGFVQRFHILASHFPLAGTLLGLPAGPS